MCVCHYKVNGDVTALCTHGTFVRQHTRENGIVCTDLSADCTVANQFSRSRVENKDKACGNVDEVNMSMADQTTY